MEVEQIERMRDFNRYYTLRLGVLTDRYLGQARPFGQARLLFEIGDGSDLGELCTRLDVGAGYLQDMLRALQEQGLVQMRDQVAELTDAGRRERADLEERSNAGIAALLGELTTGQRERLISAQDEIRRVLRAAAVVVEAVPPGSAVARDSLARYAAELDTIFPEGFDESTLTRPEDVTGTQLVAFEDGHPVGCGLWIRLGPGIAEIRHLWVAPEARGLGLGRKLLARLEVDAVNHGIDTVRLGTHPLLTEALALYRTSGYTNIGGYSDVPYNQLAFEKVLVSASAAAPGTGRAAATYPPSAASAFRRAATESGSRR
ncbi:helix-turn-helix domain-containing GNAT family N-acetyltransferase [Actinoplanes sp. NEAU-A12]|uniref:Helix-turn-helix domain-containing GNAT family N-acetyltransferase n=1 Tax=Actinoplanes sandaracinus TaxID=3045177 RepID=A0ABT6WZ94_9ACTN|nr:helix-turn-helix domain-containing GNAT family N-acetyltransferase [Actinoplanes sandaracinus]MDI6105068.1 helix-turn-helix domain-containing GNAT family N-acetyltransferase [Actinoplanes sandaracinus]